MQLIFIHGRSQEGKDPNILKQKWKDSLYSGYEKQGLKKPPNIEVKFPFYGNKLDELLNELETPFIDDVIFKGAKKDEIEADFRGKLLYEIAKNRGITDEDIKNQYSGETYEKGPLNWEWVQAILKALDKTVMGKEILEIFTRDVYVYLTNKNVRRIINDIVLSHIDKSSSVVVGHSLGTVIGYNVLRKLAPYPKNIKYITVGSPLGLETIKEQLEVPLLMPKCVVSWYNAMDERDVVSLHPLDKEHFPIQPPITNNRKVKNNTSNHHGISGYLSDINVAKQIHSALTLP